jgi:hypothetical protein
MLLSSNCSTEIFYRAYGAFSQGEMVGCAVVLPASIESTSQSPEIFLNSAMDQSPYPPMEFLALYSTQAKYPSVRITIILNCAEPGSFKRLFTAAYMSLCWPHPTIAMAEHVTRIVLFMWASSSFELASY